MIFDGEKYLEKESALSSSYLSLFSSSSKDYTNNNIDVDYLAHTYTVVRGQECNFKCQKNMVHISSKPPSMSM